ncbi:regulatory protein RecX [Flavobacterium terrae]|uniref:Regulatory protein RecX n=1 Tax=Flavobacterium terrae TaxID=415425 RepID=A0A1M6AHL6_9FLAO|nr:regulatory protein RecX [Flavobacterium terrae]SHI35969.1 regulatory protein [Flavobacterium terrae]
MNSKVYTVEEATKKIEYYCSYQDRCHDEVITKLKSLGIVPQVIDHIIVHLIEHNFLNEERFACSFARGKHNIKKWGKFRIENELKLRNISKYNITKALKEILPETYIENFHLLAEKQWDAVFEKNLLKKKKKVGDYLLRKGWESYLVYDKLEELSRSH